MYSTSHEVRISQYIGLQIENKTYFAYPIKIHAHESSFVQLEIVSKLIADRPISMLGKSFTYMNGNNYEC